MRVTHICVTSRMQGSPALCPQDLFLSLNPFRIRTRDKNKSCGQSAGVFSRGGSTFRGVTAAFRQSWKAQIDVGGGGGLVNLGHFRGDQAAARAYDSGLQEDSLQEE